MNIKGISNFTLIAHTCRCGETCVDGFPHQLKFNPDYDKRTATADCPCRKCGLIYRRRFQLTAGNPFRHRLFPWPDLFFKAVKWMPHRCVRYAAILAMWLEVNIPI